MSGHTKEPWEHVETRVYLGNDGGFDLRHTPSPEANARRIVACVNACAGLTDDDLQSGVTVIDAARSYKQQRDNLLAALKDIASRHRHRGTLTLDVEEFIDIENLIAEIEASK